MKFLSLLQKNTTSTAQAVAFKTQREGQKPGTFATINKFLGETRAKV